MLCLWAVLRIKWGNGCGSSPHTSIQQTLKGISYHLPEQDWGSLLSLVPARPPSAAGTASLAAEANTGTLSTELPPGSMPLHAPGCSRTDWCKYRSKGPLLKQRQFQVWFKLQNQPSPALDQVKPKPALSGHPSPAMSCFSPSFRFLLRGLPQ